MTLNNRSTFLFLGILLIGYFWGIRLFPLRQVPSDIEDIVERTVVLPNDTAFVSSEGMKILILVEDSGECSICNLQIYDWYIYKLEIDKRKYNCDIYYLLDNEKMSLSSEIISMLSIYKINYSYSLNDFLNLNPVLKESKYNIFLLSSENKILLVGNPVENEKLWYLYKDCLKLYSKKKE